MSYKLIKKLKSGVRIGKLTTAHGEIETPFFMPVGTLGSVKSVAPWELEEMGAQIVLSNTYHLYLRPGEKLIKKLGGLHQFMKWDKPILTDSGGYQVFSLGDRGKAKSSLVNISDEGVEFTSHLDGSKHFFTPEKVIQIQLDLGVDILMPLDVCPAGNATKEVVGKAVELTSIWAKKAKKYFDKKTKNLPIEKRPLLFGIVQGGLYPDLRQKSLRVITALDFDGYAVGGLAVDYETRDMWQTVKEMGESLPENKPRYLMGVGTPDDIIKATKFGMDMFDCVLPTRLARHGSFYAKGQIRNSNNYILLNLLNSKFREDGGVIDKNCGCKACQKGSGFSKAYLSHLVRSNEILGIRLLSLHNLWQYLSLMETLKLKRPSKK
jgi:queuine tRNA-ribosyltransferase